MAAIPLLKPKAHAGPLGIIDIGSNSIRLVIYEGANRIPSILFNEKIMAGLGRGLAKNGALDPEAVERALAALARFRRLAEDMGVGLLRTVATAAVRDASNGRAFIDELGAMGLPVELITGGEEAKLAGHGVLAAIPEADGIVGDLGGGSLELIRVRRGEVGEGISMPLGVLRLSALKLDSARVDRTLDKMLTKGGWREDARGKPFYLVGGSWRALARLHMVLSDYPLPIIHHYAFAPSEARRLVRALGQFDSKRIKELAGIASSRVATLGPAASLLAALVRRIEPSELIVSSYGLREGLLHRSLPADVRAQDPLLCATRDEGMRQGRFPEHGDLLDQWIAPLFAGEPQELARLRHASCLLADVGWRAHPEFRAERGVETALHGNWVGVDAPGRALMSQALFTHFGGEGLAPRVAEMISADLCNRGMRWGLAMRLGQRLSGGVAGPLRESRLQIDQESLVLELRGEDVALYGEAVERRHKTLAASFGRRAVVRRIT
ncbi:exopolyphosphatase/guanosine-5'-triphosphate,3'-diphosphate pyrophosphatase [Sphingomonas vulcanisoli]|uniref:Exopolyphosphatase/guanosine-5'-triphosphate, 3'-diphosphate pyrophosphatase n=1 Tax=Sphingomonas vulcanisoli TaxID=1658060 RepID=A0ABX0TSE2_9SPHN|nr:Ppx/GppA family phosphatase [Sphingomonas vulcanisoli]NIJ07039.1 exopolyphosphatase/guanosine-5'-triphosphate,3'-diphosphate pyrophosphatase [Sphingomonas vulcanisoli]